ncbi:MAG: hypothetical protein WCL06_05490 [Bacteroidota bacterium]
MKKFVFIALVLIIVMPAFQSCKKGANDPAISLKSRKARLCGVWNLTKGSEVITYSDGTIESYTYNGTQVVHEKTGQPTETKVYIKQITINKDETYAFTTTDDDYQYLDEGAWYFGPKSKELDLKNKETVCFAQKHYVSIPSGGSTTDIHMGGTHAVGYPSVWQLDRLASKELVVLIDEEYSVNSGSYTSKGSMTYEKK